MGTQRVFIALASVCFAACGTADEQVHLGAKEQAFKNQFNLEPIHEAITVQGLSFLRPDVRNILAVKNASFDAAFWQFAPAHFDNCTFSNSSLYLRENYAQAVNHAREFPPSLSCPTPRLGDCAVPTSGDLALTHFARVLHALQDFYAHSNWVEIQATGSVALPVAILDNGLGVFPLLSAGAVRGGGVIIEGMDNRGWILRPPSANQPYPQSVVPKACIGQDCLPALISGRTAGITSTLPNNCPPQLRILHDEDLAKDEANGPRLFDDARALAISQTRHEWCRFVNLVREQHGHAGDSSLYDNWVGDLHAAQCGDNVDLEANATSSPPATEPMTPGSFPAYVFSFSNIGAEAAFGATWQASFMGAIESLGSATILTQGGNAPCTVTGLSVVCQAPEPLAGGETATIVMTIVAGEPGMISMSAEVSSHNPDPVTGNDQVNLTFTIECPNDAPVWNATTEKCESCAGGLVYVANQNSFSISVIDSKTNSVTDTIPLSLPPSGVAVSKSGSRLFISHASGSTLATVVNLADKAVTSFGLGGSNAIVASPETETAFVANFRPSELARLGPSGTLGSLALACQSPAGIDIAAMNGEILVSGAGCLQHLDRSGSAVIKTIPSPSGPTSYGDQIKAKLNGTHAYLGGYPPLRLVDLQSGAISPIAFPFDTDTKGIALAPDGAFAYVAARLSGALVVLDTATDAVVGTVPVGRIPWAVAASPDGSRVYVTNLLDNSVSVVDTATLNVLATVSVGQLPFGIAVAASACP